MFRRLVIESVRHFTLEEIQKVLPYDAASYRLDEELRALTTQQFLLALRLSDFQIRGFAQHRGTGVLWGICFLEVSKGQWLPVSHFIFCKPEEDNTARNGLQQAIRDLMCLPMKIVPPEQQEYIFHGS